MTATARRTVSVLSTVLLGTFALTVWPTRYRYEHTGGLDRDLLVRIDRISGDTWCLVMGQWIKTLDNPALSASTNTDSRSMVLPDDQARLVKLTAQIDKNGWMEGTIYNGSSWRIDGIEVVVGMDRSTAQMRVRTVAGCPIQRDEVPDSAEPFDDKRRTLRSSCVPVPSLTVGKVLVNLGATGFSWFVPRFIGHDEAGK